MDKSRVKRIEQEISDAKSLRKRNPKLFWTLVIGGLVILSGYGVYEFVLFRDLRTENKDLKSENGKLKEELRDTKGARDSAQGRLASYEAIERKFPGETDAERQKLALTKLDEIASKMQAVSTVLEQSANRARDRALSEVVIQKLSAGLRQFSGYSLELGVTSQDPEVFKLANQIRTVFHNAGWKADGLSLNLGVSVQGMAVEFGSLPSPQLQRAMLPLWMELGYPPAANTNASIGENTVQIWIGPK